MTLLLSESWVVVKRFWIHLKRCKRKRIPTLSATLEWLLERDVKKQRKSVHWSWDRFIESSFQISVENCFSSLNHQHRFKESLSRRKRTETWDSHRLLMGRHIKKYLTIQCLYKIYQKLFKSLLCLDVGEQKCALTVRHEKTPFKRQGKN